MDERQRVKDVDEFIEHSASADGMRWDLDEAHNDVCVLTFEDHEEHWRWDDFDAEYIEV